MSWLGADCQTHLSVIGGPFQQQGLIHEFFRTLARQEAEHEELLETCGIAAIRGGRDGSGLDPLREDLPMVERRMREAEAKLRAVRILEDAFWLTIEIESSEINRLFQAVVAATDSDFVRKLRLFRSTVREHVSYIREAITTFEPSFGPACGRMLASCTTQSDGSDLGSRAETPL